MKWTFETIFPAVFGLCAGAAIMHVYTAPKLTQRFNQGVQRGAINEEMRLAATMYGCEGAFEELPAFVKKYHGEKSEIGSSKCVFEYGEYLVTVTKRTPKGKE